MSKIKIEDIQEELAKEGWELLSENYKNLDEEMTFKCPEGHHVFTSWKKMRGKFECPSCKANIYKEQDNKIILVNSSEYVFSFSSEGDTN